MTIIGPETLVRWHRAGFRRYWRWKSRSRGGGKNRRSGISRAYVPCNDGVICRGGRQRRGCSSGWIIQKGELRSGSYTTVLLNLASDAQLLSIPASALILDQEGLRVAVVDQGDRVHFKRVAIARDLGKEGRDSDGLTATVQVITTPLDDIADGDHVRIVGAPTKRAPETAAG